jgi:PAS domain S-box-containing protein/putative nucleotidyltransferase with HDIG domain
MARVLVVDDELSLRFTLQAFLKGAGHDVETAEDVAQARLACRDRTPDVVVSDVVLPGESGMDLLRAVRESWPRVQVVVITGEPSLETAVEAVRWGAFDYLPKPVRKDALISVVARAARMKAVLDDNARLEAENHQHRADLERLVAQRTLQLSQSEAQYRLLAENVADVIWSVDMDLKYLYLSPSAARLWGDDSIERLMREDALAPYSPEDAARLMAVLREEIVRDATPEGRVDPFRVRTVEVESHRDDGTMLPVELRMRFVRDAEGNAVGVVGVTRDIADRRAVELQLRDSLAKLRLVLRTTIEAMATTVEKRDPYTAGHQRRVSQLARAIAARMGMSEDDVDGIRLAALVHDVGKISVPSEILVKPGRLNPTEMLLMRMHSEAGYEILKDIEFPWPVAETVYQHHERWDGTGYPRGMHGEDIVLGARILGVADVVEAMASHRPYRPALGIAAALAEIRDGRGTRYNTDVVDACIQAVCEDGFQF